MSTPQRAISLTSVTTERADTLSDDDNGAVAPSVARRAQQDGGRRVARRIDFGEVELNDGAPQADVFKGRSKPASILPTKAVIRTEMLYTGTRQCVGTVVLLIGKEDKQLQYMTMYTSPTSIGKDFIGILNKKAGRGDFKEFKKDFKGLEWCGVDEAQILKHTSFLRAFGWYANVGTCGTDAKLFEVVRNLAAEIVRSNAPVDIKIADIQLTKSDIKKVADLCNALCGKIQEESDEDDNEDSD